MKGLYFAFKTHEDLILTLFSGRMNILIEKVERQMVVHYPWINRKPEKEIMLSFLIWGASHVMSESKYDETILLDTLTKVAERIIPLIGVERKTDSEEEDVGKTSLSRENV